MTENENSLDAFINAESTAEKQAVPTEEEVAPAAGTVDLEDEFAKLLNNFITHNQVPEPAKSTTDANATGGGLDGFITQPSQTGSNSVENLTGVSSASNLSGLDDFITSSSQPAMQGKGGSVSAAGNTQNGGALDSFVSGQNIPVTAADPLGLKDEERELARAIANFQDGVYALADKKNFKMPETEYTEEALKPNYKPSVGKKIAQYMLSCWDIINKYDPENMKRLSKDATDEDYLTFAETLTDTDMQLSIISYVEILINLEICENSYEQRKEIIQKNRIKRELYEEYLELQERKAMFIRKLKEKNFPVDVDKLINNYFRVAQKDPDGSFVALTKNPAMFSPIEFDKIRPKFFGLIKVTPEDGIKANQKIGSFIKKLKV